jgi:hypothetical protein
MSANKMPGGATRKSRALVPVPTEVVAEIRPEAVFAGTGKLRVVVLPTVAVATVLFIITVVAPAPVAKPVPVTETTSVAAPNAGVNEVMVGAPGMVTTKSCELVTVLAPTASEILPVVAPEGTVVVIELELDAVATAAVPLNFTVLLPGVGLNPAPLIVTDEPTEPLVGLKLVIAKPGVTWRWMLVMLPTASYVYSTTLVAAITLVADKIDRAAMRIRRLKCASTSVTRNDVIRAIATPIGFIQPRGFIWTDSLKLQFFRNRHDRPEDIGPSCHDLTRLEAREVLNDLRRKIALSAAPSGLRDRSRVDALVSLTSHYAMGKGDFG